MDTELTVVIPTYKRPALLHKCLEALNCQYFAKEKLEVIVVSDGPDAETENLVSQWPWVCYMATPEKKGPAAARNYGWLKAKSSLIAFTDDDCLPDKNWLRSFYESAAQEPLLAMTGQTIVPITKTPTDYERNIAGLQTADFITANCCCTRQALLATGGFDEQFTMAWREDSDLEFKLIRAGIPIRKIAAAVVTHPVRQASWGISIKEQRKTLYNALLYKKFPDLYRLKIQPNPPLLYYGIITAILVIAVGLLMKNELLLVSGTLVWLLLWLLFTYKRLHNTSRAPRHLAEMLITSFIIPFISIYWQWYGAIKYRVLFI